MLVVSVFLCRLFCAFFFLSTYTSELVVVNRGHKRVMEFSVIIIARINFYSPHPPSPNYKIPRLLMLLLFLNDNIYLGKLINSSRNNIFF